MHLVKSRLNLIPWSFEVRRHRGPFFRRQGAGSLLRYYLVTIIHLYLPIALTLAAQAAKSTSTLAISSSPPTPPAASPTLPAPAEGGRTPVLGLHRNRQQWGRRDGVDTGVGSSASGGNVSFNVNGVHRRKEG